MRAVDAPIVAAAASYWMWVDAATLLVGSSAIGMARTTECPVNP